VAFCPGVAKGHGPTEALPKKTRLKTLGILGAVVLDKPFPLSRLAEIARRLREP